MATVLAVQDKAEALPLLQKLHAAHPEDATITGMLDEILAVAGDIAGSDALYVILLAVAPNDADLLVSNAQNLVRLGKYPGGCGLPLTNRPKFDLLRTVMDGSGLASCARRKSINLRLRY